jgi:hypothetical protein
MDLTIRFNHLVNKDSEKKVSQDEILKKNYFLFSFINMLNTNPPIKLPYNVEFNGFEVIAHVPEAQPI